MSAVQVVGFGAQTSIGLTLPTTVAAARGAINRFVERGNLRDRAAGAPITLALAAIPMDVPVIERMRRLAAAAAAQALAPYLTLIQAARVGLSPPRLLLALPAPRPGFAEGTGARLARALRDGLPCAVDRPGSFMTAAAHAGGFAATARALDELGRGEIDVALVGGVDSYADIDTLHWIEHQARLKGEDAPFGMIPGEGAGFLLLASEAFATRHRLRSFGEIVAVAQEVEPDPWYTRRPCLAEGLTQAILGVLAPAGAEPRQATVTYADLNGESWRADEWNLAYVRTGPLQGHPLDLRHPASSWGDVGAATAPLLLGAACLDLHHHKNPGESALAWAAADVLPFRAACFLRRSRLPSEGT